MKSLIKLLSVAVLLFGAANYAKAATLYGSINGSANFTTGTNGSDSTITLSPVNGAMPASPLGTFSYNGGASRTYSQFVFTPNFDMSNPSATNGGILFTVKADAIPGAVVKTIAPTLTFTVTAPVQQSSSGSFTFWTFTGTLTYSTPNTAACVDPGPCASNGVSYSVPFTFLLSEAGNSTQVSVNGDLSPTPEPSSLMLLGTGLFGAAGVVLKRRRTV